MRKFAQSALFDAWRNERVRYIEDEVKHTIATCRDSNKIARTAPPIYAILFAICVSGRWQKHEQQMLCTVSVHWSIENTKFSMLYLVLGKKGCNHDYVGTYEL